MKYTGKLFEAQPQSDASRAESATSEHPHVSPLCRHLDESHLTRVRSFPCLFCGAWVCRLCKATHWFEFHERSSEDF